MSSPNRNARRRHLNNGYSWSNVHSLQGRVQCGSLYLYTYNLTFITLTQSRLSTTTTTNKAVPPLLMSSPRWQPKFHRKGLAGSTIYVEKRIKSFYLNLFFYVIFAGKFVSLVFLLFRSSTISWNTAGPCAWALYRCTCSTDTHNVTSLFTQITRL